VIWLCYLGNGRVMQPAERPAAIVPKGSLFWHVSAAEMNSD